jgi:hypothetical protein
LNEWTKKCAQDIERPFPAKMREIIYMIICDRFIHGALNIDQALMSKSRSLRFFKETFSCSHLELRRYYHNKSTTVDHIMENRIGRRRVTTPIPRSFAV